ncbi:MAG: YicC family protein [Clostridiales bacterium]|nr:YicC family protein [Clostridiales bacterium]
MTASMTAFGRAQKTFDDKVITVEIRSVNNRYFDCSTRLPRLFGFLEEKIRPYIQSRKISRGKIDVSVNVDLIGTVGTEVRLDDVYTKSYIDALKRLRDEFSLTDDISVMTIASNRDLFLTRKPDEDTDRVWDEVRSTVDEALDVFIAARLTEGNNLKTDILTKRDRLTEMKNRVGELSEKSIIDYRTKLETRLRTVLEDLSLEFDSQRILTECALFADKVSVDEELVRLDSHFKAMDGIFAAAEPCGRKLDFLVQEMNREINTIGSKCSDIEITSIVVDMKNELEKIREQIQNIE